MNSFTPIKKLDTEKGFTIVEVLISLTIFSIAVAGVITVAAQGGLNVNAAKDKLTATYLADEGIELMRALRDTNVAGQPTGSEADGWTAFVGNVATVCTTDAPCDIDSTNSGGSFTPLFPTTANIVACGGLTSYCPLYYDGIPGDPYEGYYRDTWPSGSPPKSLFSRRITVTPSPSSSDEMIVTSSVTWKEGIATQSITQKENIFNWY